MKGVIQAKATNLIKAGKIDLDMAKVFNEAASRVLAHYGTFRNLRHVDLKAALGDAFMTRLMEAMPFGLNTMDIQGGRIASIEVKLVAGKPPVAGTDYLYNFDETYASVATGYDMTGGLWAAGADTRRAIGELAHLGTFRGLTQAGLKATLGDTFFHPRLPMRTKGP